MRRAQAWAPILAVLAASALTPHRATLETATYVPARAPETMPTPVAAVRPAIPHPRPSAPLRASRGARRPHAPPVPANERGTQAAATALALEGSPYRWGGTGPAFDCSGLAVVAWASVGIALPRTSWSQMRLPAVSLAEIAPGDLVISNGGGHVSIYVGNGRVVHAPHRGARVRVEGLPHGIVRIVRPG